MKRFILVITLVLFFISFSNAALLVNNRERIVPDYLKVENFVRLTPAQFEIASGHHLGFFQKIYFKKLQRQLKKADYNSESNLLTYYDAEKGKFKLDTLWFILGCIIGPFAVLFSYTSHNQSTNKHISALIGMGVFIIWFGWLALF